MANDLRNLTREHRSAMDKDDLALLDSVEESGHPRDALRGLLVRILRLEGKHVPPDPAPAEVPTVTVAESDMQAILARIKQLEAERAANPIRVPGIPPPPA